LKSIMPALAAVSIFLVINLADCRFYKAEPAAGAAAETTVAAIAEITGAGATETAANTGAEQAAEPGAEPERADTMAGYNSRFHPAHISSREAKELADSNGGAAILDVRSEASYLDRHVVGAANVPFDAVAEYAGTNLPDKDALILCYCFCDDKGGSALSAYELLAELGYTNVYYFEPGGEWAYSGALILTQPEVALPTNSIITGREAKELYDSNPAVILLDVRSKEEYDAGHVGGSALIPVDDLESRLSELPDKDAVIIVFCRSGRRSAIAAGIFKDNGYVNVYDMQAVTNWPEPLQKK